MSYSQTVPLARVVLLFVVFVVFPICVKAQTTTFPIADPFPLLDLDGDGSSDVVILKDQADGSPDELVYTYRESSTGFLSSAIEFGNSADVPALGDYDGDTVTDIAVVRNTGSSLTWITRIQNGDDTSETLGVPGDFILTGCDFDDDGETDPAVFRLNQGILYLDSEGETQRITVNLRANEQPTRLACGDFDDDQTGEIALVVAKQGRTGPRSRSRIAIFTNSGSEVFSRKIRSPRSIFVFDADGDGDLDLGAFYKRKRTAFLFTYTNNGSLNFTSRRARLKRAARTITAQALYNAESNSWSVVFRGKRDKFFELNQSNNQVVGSSFARIRGDKLLPTHTVESTT